MMTAHQRETEFLKQCIRYDDTEERHRLEERITQIQRDERIVRRAVWLMALLAALAMAGLGYGAVFMAEYPLNVSQLITLFLIKALCVLGAGSLSCLFGFLGLGVLFRRELDQRREDCRRLALEVLKSRLGDPRDLPRSGLAKARDPILNASRAALPGSREFGLAGDETALATINGVSVQVDRGAVHRHKDVSLLTVE